MCPRQCVPVAAVINHYEPHYTRSFTSILYDDGLPDALQFEHTKFHSVVERAMGPPEPRTKRLKSIFHVFSPGPDRPREVPLVLPNPSNAQPIQQRLQQHTTAGRV